MLKVLPGACCSWDCVEVFAPAFSQQNDLPKDGVPRSELVLQEALCEERGCG